MYELESNRNLKNEVKVDIKSTEFCNKCMATHYNRPLCDSLCRIDSENKIMVYIKHSIESIQTICSMLVYCRYNYFLPSCINTAKLLDFCCEYLKHAHHTNTFQTILLNSILVGVTYNYVMFKSFVYLTWIWPKLCRKHVGIPWHISKRAVSAIDIAKKNRFSIRKSYEALNSSILVFATEK